MQNWIELVQVSFHVLVHTDSNKRKDNLELRKSTFQNLKLGMEILLTIFQFTSALNTLFVNLSSINTLISFKLLSIEGVFEIYFRVFNQF